MRREARRLRSRRIHKADLFQQTLGDILANRFRLRLTCPKACILRSEVEIIVADKRLLLYGVSSKHRLAAGRLTTIPIRFKTIFPAGVSSWLKQG